MITFFFFWSCHTACGILVPQPQIELGPSAVEELQVLTTRLPKNSGHFLSYLLVLLRVCDCFLFVIMIAYYFLDTCYEFMGLQALVIWLFHRRI